MKLMGRMAKYTWQDNKTNEDILSELKINPVVNKIQITVINWYNMFDEWTETDWHTQLYQPCGKQN